MSPPAFMRWLREFAVHVADGRPTAVQWVQVLATLASVRRNIADPRDLQITFLRGGAVRTDEFRLTGCAL
ncbi:hypothetical protein ASG40_12925 [Methylobacterium sp. Leaf399]|uniref:hypothetical protein n=1 Tax=Methylobacterium sp. Leaf399 TaxID=1736364 RepID=UPI0006F8644D|nr:hypothetical protein [Methylobacterium sp. Leaf399]KQT07804.1 hypothetical protein ASG40_12925 [Methylobacterium sp. Leaf399]